LTNVVKYDYIARCPNWFVASRGSRPHAENSKRFRNKSRSTWRLTEAARGRKADTAKPFKGVGSGVFEIAERHRGDAFRAIYAVQIGDDIWVVDAFQKKSKSGIKTPRMDVDRIKERLKRLKEALR
jgi:phage-related protein